jgi:hypothetical protein
LPYFNDYQVPASPTPTIEKADLYTQVWVDNAYDGAGTDTLTITAKKRDGTNIHAPVNVTLNRNGQYVFLPSQFFGPNDSAPFEGSIEISGRAPVAVAFSSRFTQTTSSISNSLGVSRKTRIHSSQILPFVHNAP